MGESKRRKAARQAGVNVPDRKFLSEFAVSLFSARWLMITPDQLASDGKMEERHMEIAKLCHIYLICRRPLQNIDPSTFYFDGNYIEGTMIYKISGVEVRVPFKHQFPLVDGAVRLDLPYPYREIHTLSEDGEVIRYLPVSALSIITSIQDVKLRQLEVLYVGQSFGDGSRTAIDRLRSHSTLQNILANTHYKFPDDEIQILMFEYAPYAMMASFDGIDKKAIRDHRDGKRINNISKGRLSKKQQVCLAEAGLIRYFEPSYNEIFKSSFPASDQKTLSECYELDFSALSVEINTEDLNLALYSGCVDPSQHHIAKFDLVNPDTRRSFFTFVDREGKAFETEDVIPPSR